MRKVPAFLGLKLSDTDLRRLEMAAELDRISKSGFARAAIAEAVRQRFAAEGALPAPPSHSTALTPAEAA